MIEDLGDIPAIDHSCGSFAPGHQVHWIQARKATESARGVLVQVSVEAGGEVRIAGDSSVLLRWNHDPERLRAALKLTGGRALWDARWNVMTVQAGFHNYLFSLAATGRQPCRLSAAVQPLAE